MIVLRLVGRALFWFVSKIVVGPWVVVAEEIEREKPPVFEN